MTLYEAVIKVRVDDPPHVRARDIADGIGYACALLADEYSWDAAEIIGVLEGAIDDVEGASA